MRRSNIIANLVHAGHMDLADQIMLALTDRQPAGEVRFSTHNGDFIAIVGPVHTKFNVRPVELYKIDHEGREIFIGYAAPDKIKKIPNEYRGEASKALVILDKKGLLPGDPTPPKLRPAEKQRIINRIYKNMGEDLIKSILIFDQADSRQTIEWQRTEEHRAKPGTLFLIRRPDGMWISRFVRRGGVNASENYMKTPLQAVNSVLRNVTKEDV